jgi:hypothetical protein
VTPARGARAQPSRNHHLPATFASYSGRILRSVSTHGETAMMLDDVIGSDRDEFPLEQIQGLLGRFSLDEDWDDPVAPCARDCSAISFEDPGGFKSEVRECCEESISDL